jgi:hypothetical protein
MEHSAIPIMPIVLQKSDRPPSGSGREAAEGLDANRNRCSLAARSPVLFPGIAALRSPMKGLPSYSFLFNLARTLRAAVRPERIADS